MHFVILFLDHLVLINLIYFFRLISPFSHQFQSYNVKNARMFDNPFGLQQVITRCPEGVFISSDFDFVQNGWSNTVFIEITSLKNVSLILQELSCRLGNR